jgi:protein-tyrosine-phosphatase
MLFEILSAVGGASTIGLLIAFLWARAGKASAQKAAAEQERFAEELKAALEAAQKARTEEVRRLEAVIRMTRQKLEEALNACPKDPVAILARLRDLLSAPPPADRGGAAGGPLPP